MRISYRSIGPQLLEELFVSKRLLVSAFLPCCDILEILSKKNTYRIVDELRHGLTCLGCLQAKSAMDIVFKVHSCFAHIGSMPS